MEDPYPREAEIMRMSDIPDENFYRKIMFMKSYICF